MMRFDGIKLKVDPPGKFSGTTKDNYEDFENDFGFGLGLDDEIDDLEYAFLFL